MSKLNQKCSRCRVPLPDKFSRQRPYLCSSCEILEEQKKHNKILQDDLRETQRLQRQNANRQRRQQEQEDAQYLAEQADIQRQPDEEQARIEAEQEAQRVERLKQNLEVHKKHLDTLPGVKTYDCFHCKNKNVMIEHLNWTASTYLYDQDICYTPPYCQFCGVQCIVLPTKEKFLFKDYLVVLLLGPSVVFIKFLLWLSIIIWIFMDISYLEILYKTIAASIVIGSIWCLLEGNVKTDISDRTPHFISKGTKYTWDFQNVMIRKKWFIFGKSIIIGKEDKNNEFSNLQKTISQKNFHPYATGGARIWRGYKWLLIKFLPIFIFLFLLNFLVIGFFSQNIRELIGGAVGGFLFFVLCILGVYLSYKFSKPNSTHYTQEDYYLLKGINK